LKVKPDRAGDINGSFSMRMFDTVVVGQRGNTWTLVVGGGGDGVVAVELEVGTVSISRIRESAELAGEWLWIWQLLSR
jgi:hypothetical protein